MTKHITARDWNLLSAYLDGELQGRELSRLEERLDRESALRQAFEELRRIRITLRSQPRMRAPRNFTLTTEMVAVRGYPRRSGPWIPAFGFASALAGLMLVLVLVGDLLVGPGLYGARQAESGEIAMFSADEAPLEMETPPAEALALQAAPPTDTQAAKSAPETETMQTDQANEEMLERSLDQPSGMGGGVDTGSIEPQPEMPAAASIAPEGTPYPSLAMPLVELAIPQGTPYPQMEQTPTSALELVQEVSQPEADAATAQSGWWTSWRITEVFLAVLALLSGLVAILLRRIR